MSYLNALLTDLRDRKLWPVPLVLLAALVAVPVFLSTSPSPQHPAPIPGLAIAAAQPGASVTVDATPVQASLTAGSRDPFTQQKLPGAPSSSTTGSTGSTASTASSGTGSSATVSSSTGSVSSSGSHSSSGSSSGANGTYTGGGSATTTGTTGTTTAPKHPAAAAGLTRDQSYDVMLATPLNNGGFTTTTAQRGTELPSPQQSQLVELGVAQGGRSVLFAVMPNTVVSGPGSCVPGPLDCEILSLAPNESESIGVPTSTTTHWLGSFTLTSISAHTWSSASQAATQRGAANPAGERLVARTSEHAFSLFSYNPSLGVVVDERNLQVGGN